ncbi:LysR family transcriptional regulator [Spiribacter salinus M19-40]|jgi:DNA-binding transcriptional LysR family regulator|uniref:LysR family transcriptional regulator n=1 Tax=Spiribacter salinus M19-40 TaxID=1260251 RepID=R4VHU3_9GAMM|nr:LysR family transcriptional regulator [Spiribacter salinus]AGM40192.1 LysR family transcriptional regulator [Spiribacter salinus M19-40]MDR9414101.1 LysR family transcriptional regulator [Spiribacter sp.]MDR9455284.1 LysR family transcriptional regulator [Spiribacter sp.]
MPTALEPNAAYRHDRLRQLRAFCFTAEAGSISRAAERLGLTQPSVSLQIQALERELSVTLFERRGPRIRLTPEGEQLYAEAHQLVEAIDGLAGRFSEDSRPLDSGRLDIGAGESSTLYLLPATLEQFMAEHPNVRVRLHHLSVGDLMDALREDRVDFAVGAILDMPDELRYRAIYSYGLSLITPPDHPLARRDVINLRDLAGQDFIIPPQNMTTWRLISLVFQQHAVPYRIRLEVGSWEAVKRYVGLGFGIAIVSNVSLAEHYPGIVVRSLPEVFPKRTYGAMSRRGRFLSPQARRFLEMMRPDFFADDVNAI